MDRKFAFDKVSGLEKRYLTVKLIISEAQLRNRVRLLGFRHNLGFIRNLGGALVVAPHPSLRVSHFVTSRAAQRIRRDMYYMKILQRIGTKLLNDPRNGELELTCLEATKIVYELNGVCDELWGDVHKLIDNCGSTTSGMEQRFGRFLKSLGSFRSFVAWAELDRDGSGCSAE